MKEDRLFTALTDIDDDLVEEAARKKVPVSLPRLGGIAAAAAAVVVAVALLPWGEWFAPAIGIDPSDTPHRDTTTGQQSATEGAANTTANGATTTANGATTTTNANTTVKKSTTVLDGGNATWKPTATMYAKDPELALVPKWEEKTVKQKYPEIPYGAAMYSVYYAIDPKQVGQKLTTVTATGQDVYTDTYHTTKVTLYRLADIAPQCAVAIQYEGVDDYYSAVSTWYQPLTLGEFLDGLQLEKYGTFSTASWDYFDQVYHYRTYEGVTAQAVFDLLLDDPSLPNVHKEGQSFYDTINISVDLPILGLENPVVMMLSEDGYLFTNLLGCGKTFYVGTARVEAFKNYLQKNCTCTVLAVTTQATTEPTDTQPPVTGTTKTKPAQPPRTSGAYIPE